MARTGTSSITKGRNKVVVEAASTAADSYVGITFTEKPDLEAGSAVVSYIEKEAGVGFTVYLTTAAKFDADFDYYIV